MVVYFETPSSHFVVTSSGEYQSMFIFDGGTSNSYLTNTGGAKGWFKYTTSELGFTLP